nr:MAG TPA: hypothetical protein [Caudoviricetes sp.]
MKSEFSEIQTPASSGWFIVSANSVYHALLRFSSHEIRVFGNSNSGE